MYSGEKKTIYYVLALYLSSTLLLVTTLFTGYYFFEKDRLHHEEQHLLQHYASELETRLAQLHESNEEILIYPRSQNYKSAIYDSDKTLLFSTLDATKPLDSKSFLRDEKHAYHISKLSAHYLGAAFLLIQTDSKPLGILKDIPYIALFIIFIVITTSYFLIDLILKPLRDTVTMLDNFLKDTTHELNTPVTAILTNIETISTADCDQKTHNKLKRIHIASKNISILYQDLAYLLLNHTVASQDQRLHLSEILHERINYFLDMAQLKRLTFELTIKKDIYFFADKSKIERLLDNLLSNAIKYAKKETKIKVVLDENFCILEDEGKGMSEEELRRVFLRYSRFDKTQGGFGIGYSIVKSIADAYNIHIEIESSVGVGTKVTLRW